MKNNPPPAAVRDDDRLLALLDQPDAILEPSAPATYRALVAPPTTVGRVTVVNNRMVDSFVGVPCMANMLSSWMKIAGSKSDADAVITTVLGDALADGRFQIKTADAAFRDKPDEARPFLTEVASSDRWWASVERLRRGKGAAGASPLLEALRVRREAGLAGVEVVDDRVAPDVEMGERESEGEAGRCTQALFGFAREMSRGPVSGAVVEKFFESCVESATFDDLAMVLWLRALADVARACENALVKQLMRRAAQRVQEACVAKAMRASPVSEKAGKDFVTKVGIVVSVHSAKVQGLEERVVADLYRVVDVIGNGREVRKTEIKRLAKIYGPMRPKSAQEEEEGVDYAVKPVSDMGKRVAYLELISSPEVMAMMWRKLFVRKVRLPEDPLNVAEDANEPMRNCICMLLALAAAFVRIRMKCGSLRAAELLESELEQKAVRYEEDIIVSCAAICSVLHPDSTARAFTEKASERLVPKTVGLSRGSYDSFLREGIQKSEVAAHGIVMWAREGVTDSADADKLVKSCFRYVSLLELAADRWSSARGDVLQVFADAYGRVWWARTDSNRNLKIEDRFRVYYGKGLRSMIRLGYGVQAMDVYRKRFANDLNIDPAQVRRFVSEVIDHVKLPFSRQFADSLLDLLDTKRVISSVRSGNQASSRTGGKVGSALISKFLYDLQNQVQSGLDEKRLSEVRDQYL